MSPVQFYEFMDLIRDARFKGIDTHPEEVKDKEVRMAWRAVRPSVLKSARNARYYNKSNQEPEEQVSTYAEPMVNVEIEKPAAPQVSETIPKAAPKTESIPAFGTQGEFVDYLVDYRKTHNKFDTEMFRNYRCREYGFNIDDVINEYNQKTTTA